MIEYVVYRVGGSLSEQKNADKFIGGRQAKKVKSFSSKRDAKEFADRRRMSLTPGEKSYYRIGYRVIKEYY